MTHLSLFSVRTGISIVTKKILIVDDENLIRYALTGALRKEGVCARAVACGKDAHSELNNNVYDLCIFDIHLPDMNGLDIMKFVRNVSPVTKIIIMTGSEIDAAMLQLIQENAHLLMTKPFDLDRVKKFVENIVEHDIPVDQARKNYYQDTDCEMLLNWPADDKRRCERNSMAQKTTCCIVASDDGQEETNLIVSILNISETGMCIQAGRLLKPGHLLRFSGDGARGTGVVRWSMSDGTEGLCHAGVQFTVPEQALFPAPQQT